MVEILDAGIEAETCHMAGRGMNGLRGTVVCFNASNQRYTLELDSGEMMSLRARNVAIYSEATFVGNEDDVDASISSKGDESPPSNVGATEKEKEQEPALATKKPVSSLPKYDSKALSKSKESKHAQQGGNADKKDGNIIDRVIYGLFNNVLDMSPSVLLFAIFVAYGFQKYMSGALGGSAGSKDNEEGNDSGSSSSSYAGDEAYDNDYYYYGHHRRSYYGQWSWGYGWNHFWHWGYYSLSGLFSVVVVSFFIWQFGTKKGSVDFRWYHVKARVAQFDFWEVMRYGMLLEGVFLFVSRMAASGGGGRRRR